MAFISGNHLAVAVDTPERLTTLLAGSSYSWANLTLDPLATGPARWGGPTVSNATQIGNPINPGETVLVASGSGPNTHHTGETYLAFSGNAAGDNIAWTVCKS